MVILDLEPNSEWLRYILIDENATKLKLYAYIELSVQFIIISRNVETIGFQTILSGTVFIAYCKFGFFVSFSPWVKNGWVFDVIRVIFNWEIGTILQYFSTISYVE